MLGERVTIYISPKNREVVETAMRISGMSLSAIVAEACRHINALATKDPLESIRALTLQIQGIVRAMEREKVIAGNMKDVEDDAYGVW